MKVKVKILPRDPRETASFGRVFRFKHQALRLVSLLAIGALVYNAAGQPMRVRADDGSGGTATLTVIKHVVGGSKQAGDFTINLTSGISVGAPISQISFPGSETGTPETVNPGGYIVGENADSNYTASFSGDCGSQGQGSVNIGDSQTCTITNTYTGGGSGSTTPADFSLNISLSGGGSGTVASADNSINCGSHCSASYASGTAVTLTAAPDASSTFTGWGGACLSSGSSTACNLAISDNTSVSADFEPANSGGGNNGGSPTSTTGSLVVTKLVIGGNATSSDFIINVAGPDDQAVGFAPGSSTGTAYTDLAPGGYAISEANNEGYVASYSAGCPYGAATVTAGHETDCTVTNTWQLNISNEQTADATTTSVTITWTTNHLATSRVVYDTVSHSDASVASSTGPDYGYASSTAETDDSPMLTGHSVTVTGLTVGTTYYFRPVSHGSPEVVGGEISAATAGNNSGGSSGSPGSGPSGGGSSSGSGSGVPTGGGSSSITGGSGGTGTSTKFSGLNFPPAGQIAGAFTSLPNPQIPQVLGASTGLPRTGVPVAPTILLFLALAALYDRAFKLI